MLEGRYPVKYLKRRAVEIENQIKRRMLWLGKFAFPKVNTKRTKLLFVPPEHYRHYIPVVEPLSIDWFSRDELERLEETTSPLKTEVVDLNEWGYNGTRWRAIIRFGYYEKDDVLIVCKESFVYQQRHKVSDGSSWWF
jgi:hypothetical protein